MRNWPILEQLKNFNHHPILAAATYVSFHLFSTLEASVRAAKAAGWNSYWIPPVGQLIENLTMRRHCLRAIKIRTQRNVRTQRKVRLWRSGRWSLFFGLIWNGSWWPWSFLLASITPITESVVGLDKFERRIGEANATKYKATRKSWVKLASYWRAKFRQLQEHVRVLDKIGQKGLRFALARWVPWAKMATVNGKVHILHSLASDGSSHFFEASARG